MSTATGASAKLQSEELRDAYRVWLKDLHDDNPEKLVRKLDKKKKNGGRVRRKQRTLHAQQHTAASALKDVVLQKTEQAKLPILSLVHTPADKKALQDSQSRRHEALADEANYSAVQYVGHHRPGLGFFQQLVNQLLQKPSQEASSRNISSPGLVTTELVGFPVLVAPILLRVNLRYRDKNRLGVALLFCQEENQDEHQIEEANGGVASFVLHCRVYMQASSWQEHRSTLLELVSNPSAEIWAVRKYAENFESRKNELQLLYSRQEVEKAMNELWVNSSDNVSDSSLLAIQKYIPFKRASSRTTASPTTTNMILSTERKPWIARCASRKRNKHSSTVWIISGGDVIDDVKSTSMAITNSSSADCQLVKCTIDQAWSKPRLLASMCTIPLEKALRIRFNELVVDMLQDTSGTWWLLQVKAFTIAALRPLSAATSIVPKKTPLGLSRTQSAPTRFELDGALISQWKKWRCTGRYCSTKTFCKSLLEPTNPKIGESIDGPRDNNKEPSGYLTKKMLRSCEFYADFVQQQDMSLAGGFTDFHSALAFHLQHRLPKRDRSQLYEPQPLCSACVKRYHSLRQQWMETVKPAAVAGHRRNIRHAKAYSDTVEHTSLPPRQLPSLNRESEHSSSLNSTYSSPDLPDTRIKQIKQEDNATGTKQSHYLDELAAMEEMLAEHEPASYLSTTKRDFQSPTQSQVETSSSSSVLNALQAKPSSSHDIFHKWDGGSRIEKMWQNLTFKPLERQLTDPRSDLSDSSRANQGYNSISLQQELIKLSATDEEHTTPEIKLHNEVTQSSGSMKSVTAHAVHVQHCRRVFEDEIYREDLVNEVVRALRSGKSNVCFVVTPHTCNPEIGHTDQRAGEDEDELVEMALRSLYIDVKQAIVASSDDCTSDLLLSSWPLRPKVCREISGCITVKLGPA